MLLEDCERSLKAIEGDNHTNQVTWQIPQQTPLKTIPTSEFEPGGNGGDPVWGELSFAWEISRVSTTDALTSRHLCLSGNASTQVRIRRMVDGQPHTLTQWQIEVGAANSPGWHFHTGIAGEFPVPRVPGVLVLPTDGLDFLLGEIFQDSWRAKVAKDSPETRFVGKHQRERFGRWCRWQETSLRESHGSCWSWLKHIKPPADLFMA